MTISKYDIDNIQKILSGEGDWFTAQLLRLIAKADKYNREMLRLSFPTEVEVYEKWLNEN